MSRRPPLAHYLVRALPKRAITVVAGAAASARVPAPARATVYRAYASAVGADLDECDGDLESFPTFNEFFTRPLVHGARTWDEASILASPCDGRLDACGVVEAGVMVQAKGIEYGIDELLGDSTASSTFDGGAYATVYLSPADYHRVHAPADLTVDRVVYVPGELWPVNGLSVPWVDGLFRRNERVVFHGRLAAGPRFALVMVGATVVGKIRVAHPDVSTCRASTVATFDLEADWSVGRGDELGAFLLGSTVIVIVDSTAGCAPPDRGDGRALRLGDPLFVAAGGRA